MCPCFINTEQTNLFSLPTSFIAIFLLLNPLATSSASAVTFDKPTVYEILVGYNFPIGILPKGATGYELDRATGKLHAFLNETCDFSLEGGYQLKYKSTVSGCISDSKLTKLTGVSVKVLFLWLNIVEVVRDGDTLQFSVGIASANFPIDNFYECPQCGCGLDCDNVTEKCVKGFKRSALEQRCGRLLGFALAGLHDGLKLIKIDALRQKAQQEKKGRSWPGRITRLVAQLQKSRSCLKMALPFCFI